MIDAGGVQCGFCTPGILISSRALLDRNPASDRDEIRDALVGNLCRCTGYMRIIEAVKKRQQCQRELQARKDGPGDDRWTTHDRTKKFPSPIGESVSAGGCPRKSDGRGDFRRRYPVWAGIAVRAHHAQPASARPDQADRHVEGQALPGVKAVVTGEEFPGLTGLYLYDRYIFCRDRVRYVGDPVAGVAADQRRDRGKGRRPDRGGVRAASSRCSTPNSEQARSALLHPDLGKYEVAELHLPAAGHQYLQPLQNSQRAMSTAPGRSARRSSSGSTASRTCSTCRSSRMWPWPKWMRMARSPCGDRSQSPFAQRNLIAKALQHLAKRCAGDRAVRRRRLRLQGGPEHGSAGGRHRHESAAAAR